MFCFRQKIIYRTTSVAALREGMDGLVPPTLLRPIFVNRANPLIFFCGKRVGRRGPLLGLFLFLKHDQNF